MATIYRDITELKRSQHEAVEGKRLAEQRFDMLRRLLDQIGLLAKRCGLPEVEAAAQPFLKAGPREVPSEEMLSEVLVPFDAAFQSIQKANRTLASQNQDLTQAKGIAEIAIRELEAFSYSVAHDLRAPLRSIDGFGQMLEEDCGGNLDENCRGHLSIIRKSTHRMAQVIDDLLKLSQIGKTEVRRSKINLSDFANEVINRLKKLKSARIIEWILPPVLAAEADPNLVRILLDNLLRNAYKYSAKQEQARIELGIFEVPGETIYFVRDNGVGFDPAYAHKLFKPFQRLHAGTEFEGMGIGLSIVRRIVERHGGRIWAESAPERGATFYFTLMQNQATAG
jgi:light-regulated signal transduction histidine kinase (bacteriophytochrome)